MRDWSRIFLLKQVLGALTWCPTLSVLVAGRPRSDDSCTPSTLCLGYFHPLRTPCVCQGL